jgi:hypothetical protein
MWKKAYVILCGVTIALTLATVPARAQEEEACFSRGEHVPMNHPWYCDRCCSGDCSGTAGDGHGVCS